jgi:ferredoxin--NADP+ reductase
LTKSVRLNDTKTRHSTSAEYNAMVIDCRDVHEDLRVLRVRPAGWKLDFLAGQYTVLGLRMNAPSDDAETGGSGQAAEAFIKRAYSLSCSMLSPSGVLLTATAAPYLEFYLTQVHRPESPRPSLSPRLFHLTAGDWLYVGPHARGRYTLAPVKSGDNVVLMATGTGEAPHNAMVAELLASGHEGRILCVTCVRYRRDLGYLEIHRELERRYQQYRYVALTTREPENVDPRRPDYIGKQYLQNYVASESFQAALGTGLDGHQTHVYLCGNPVMIGAPLSYREPRQYPSPQGMIEVLERKGFRIDEPDRAGNIHFEKYW